MARTLASLSKHHAHLRALAADDRGNIALIFALLLLPVLLAIGGAVDFVRTIETRGAIQSSAELAALAAATPEALLLSENKRRERAEKAFAAHMEGRGLDDPRVTDARFTADTVAVDATAYVPTSFLKLIGMDQIEISAEVEVTIPETRVGEMVFVFDFHTPAHKHMKDGLADLIGRLTNQGADDTARIGLVPFGDVVYAGLSPAYRRPEAVDAATGKPTGESAAGAANVCLLDRPLSAALSDQLPAQANPDTLWPAILPDSGNGSNVCRHFERANASLRPLSSQHRETMAAVRDIGAMVDTWSSEARLANALALGWAVLSPTAAYEEGTRYGDPKTPKTMVVIATATPGENNPDQSVVNKHSESVGGDDVAYRNAARICDAMKARGVRIVTAIWDVNGKSFDLGEEKFVNLQHCASEDDDFVVLSRANDVRGRRIYDAVVALEPLLRRKHIVFVSR